jgi:hypothetical protein
MSFRTILFTVLLFAPLASLQSAPGIALKTDSPDGVWRFYPAESDLRLRRVLLIGDSIMNGYRHGVTSS